jgi:farnesyl-diphosphate farnesyltransferase
MPAELASLLARVSPTFSLTIPRLPEPLATDAQLAYLLLRLAHTLADAPAWGRDARLAALDSFEEWLVGDPEERAWLDAVAARPPTDAPGCRALLLRADVLRAALTQREDDAATTIHLEVVRATGKMAELVAQETVDGRLELRSVEDVRAYGYAVGGIGSELLTSLLLLRCEDLDAARDALLDLAPALGEGLALVDLLKRAVARPHLLYSVDRDAVATLARADVAKGAAYVDALVSAGAPAAVRHLARLPLCLAEATLLALTEGRGRLSRAEEEQLRATVLASG